MLLVEDEILVRMLLEDAFDDLGISYEAAGDGQTAQALLPQVEPRVLVTDINLGHGPDGFEVARAARRRNPDISVIYVTGHASHLAAQGVARSVMVSKPFDPDRLARQVAALVGGAST